MIHAGLLLVLTSIPSNDSENHFDQKIAPLLASQCLECHSGARPKGKLDLSQRLFAMKGGRKGKAIVKGDPEKSLLWHRIRDDEMPPKHPLSCE